MIGSACSSGECAACFVQKCEHSCHNPESARISLLAAAKELLRQIIAAGFPWYIANESHQDYCAGLLLVRPQLEAYRRGLTVPEMTPEIRIYLSEIEKRLGSSGWFTVPQEPTYGGRNAYEWVERNSVVARALYGFSHRVEGIPGYQNAGYESRDYLNDW